MFKTIIVMLASEFHFKHSKTPLLQLIQITTLFQQKKNLLLQKQKY